LQDACQVKIRGNLAFLLRSAGSKYRAAADSTRQKLPPTAQDRRKSTCYTGIRRWHGVCVVEAVMAEQVVCSAQDERNVDGCPNRNANARCGDRAHQRRRARGGH